jgi:hypothetical protein
VRARARQSIRELPVELRRSGQKPTYQVRISNSLRNLATRGEKGFEQGG